MLSILFFVTGLIAVNFNSAMNIYQANFEGPSPLWYSPLMIKHSEYLIRSCYDLCRVELVDMKLLKSDPFEAAKSLFFDSTKIVLSHGIQNDKEGPLLNYGNVAALSQWDASWEELTTMPSKYTASDQDREQREKFMKTVRDVGFVDNYSGVRVNTKGESFQISDALVWNIVIDNVKLGQAACLREWERI